MHLQPARHSPQDASSRRAAFARVKNPWPAQELAIRRKEATRAQWAYSGRFETDWVSMLLASARAPRGAVGPTLSSQLWLTP